MITQTEKTTHSNLTALKRQLEEILKTKCIEIPAQPWPTTRQAFFRQGFHTFFCESEDGMTQYHLRQYVLEPSLQARIVSFFVKNYQHSPALGALRFIWLPKNIGYHRKKENIFVLGGTIQWVGQSLDMQMQLHFVRPNSTYGYFLHTHLLPPYRRKNDFEAKIEKCPFDVIIALPLDLDWFFSKTFLLFLWSTPEYRDYQERRMRRILETYKKQGFLFPDRWEETLEHYAKRTDGVCIYPYGYPAIYPHIAFRPGDIHPQLLLIEAHPGLFFLSTPLFAFTMEKANLNLWHYLPKYLMKWMISSPSEQVCQDIMSRYEDWFSYTPAEENPFANASWVHARMPITFSHLLSLCPPTEEGKQDLIKEIFSFPLLTSASKKAVMTIQEYLLGTLTEEEAKAHLAYTLLTECEE